MFYVIGLDSGPGGHVELTDCATLAESRAWIQDYTRWDNWGGYEGLAIENPRGRFIETFTRESEHV